MSIKESAQQLNGRGYRYSMFTKREIQIAKGNSQVIVSGVSNDSMEFKGASRGEGNYSGGGKVYPSKSGVYNGEDDKADSQNCIEALWCNKTSKDEDGNAIPWTYKTDIPHEALMVYKDGESYCLGIMFSINDLK